MVIRLSQQLDDSSGPIDDADFAILPSRGEPARVGASPFSGTKGEANLSAATSSTTGNALNLDRVCKKFGDADIVKSVSLGVPSGQILSLLGPSGCGKTTILRLIAGFLRPTSGLIRIGGQEANDIPPHRRRLGMVFQNYSLFPHMTVAENVSFGLKMQGFSAGASRAPVEQALAMVRMNGMERRYPAELSGGQQQRVALARAVVTRPRLLLLDEPFGALDRKLREELQIEVKQLQRELGITFVFVTHDQEEALTISDCIAVMRNGEIQQFGNPAEIFETPANLFVAEVFGALNTLPVLIAAREGVRTIVSWQGRQFTLPSSTPSGLAIGSEALFAVRTNDVRFSSVTSSHDGESISGVVEDLIYKGSTVLCRVRLQDGTLFVATAERGILGPVESGRTVHLSWQSDKAFVFPRPSTGAAGPSSSL
jgi:putative spermidine/putrescine transport system ATP-binding protein